jgi:hypothetical protein
MRREERNEKTKNRNKGRRGNLEIGSEGSFLRRQSEDGDGLAVELSEQLGKAGLHTLLVAALTLLQTRSDEAVNLNGVAYGSLASSGETRVPDLLFAVPEDQT